MSSSASHYDQFSYMPLTSTNAMRLLVIEPGPYEAPLQCRLLRTTLDTCPPYFALSYAWKEHRTETVLRKQLGDEIDTPKWLSINLLAPPSVEHNVLSGAVSWLLGNSLDYEPMQGTLPTNLNLSAALKRIRNPSGHSVYIWIDMFCINQNDDTEKVAQLQIMKDIFQKAGCVIIWLGEHTKKDELVFQHLDNFAEVTRSWDKGVPILLEPDRVRSSQFAQKHGIPTPDNPAARALLDFFSREWFKRKWCIQELCVANEDDPPELWCGHFRCNWRDVGLVARWIRKSGYSSKAAEFNEVWADWLAQMRDDCERRNISRDEGQAATSLLALLYRTARFQASVAHDKLYALFGMSSDFRDTSGNFRIQPNYKQPISEVCLELALALIDKDQSLTPLQYATCCRRRDPTLPTWCPDWLSPAGGPMPHGGWHPFPYNPFRASATTTPDLRTTPVSKVLGVRGMKIDEVIWEAYGFLPPSHSNSPSAEIPRSFRMCWELIWEKRDLFGFLGTKEELFDTYWRTLMTATSFPLAMWSGHEACHALKVWEQLYKDAPEQLPAIPAAHPDCAEADVRFYRHRMNLNCGERKFILTKNGRMGWAPNKTERNDPIFILKGGCVPFVLRKIAADADTNLSSPPDSAEKYLLIGDSYVHGVMYGELIRDQTTGLESQWLDIDLV